MLLKQFLMDEYRFLTFRAPSGAIREHPGAYLAFGLLLTWAAGVGRYWDSPDAFYWQYLGFASLAYVFLLALVLWSLVAPLGPRNWSYRNVLLFLALTAPPALLYAVPVERFLELATAHAVNSAFLAVVATWRVALLFVFLKSVAGLTGFTIVIAALLPLALVIDGIALMGFQQVVYQNMVGAHDPEGQTGTGRDIVDLVCMLAMVLTPVLGACYAWMVSTRTSAHPLRGCCARFACSRLEGRKPQ